MRGLLSFFIVIAALPTMLALAALQGEVASKASLAARSVLALERRYYADLEVKEALLEVLRNSRGASRDELARNAAENLAALESFVEERFRTEGVEVDLWAGAASENEVADLKHRMLAAKKPLKCRACFDFAAYDLDWRGKPSRKTAGMLDAREGRLFVSRGGLARIPGLENALDAALGGLAFGASFYFPGEEVAAVALAREGFGGQ